MKKKQKGNEKESVKNVYRYKTEKKEKVCVLFKNQLIALNYTNLKTTKTKKRTAKNSKLFTLLSKNNKNV